MNFRTHPHHKLAFIGLALLMVVGIAACGGGHKTTTTKTTATKTKRHRHKAKPKVTETVRLDKAGAKFQASLAASTGDVVEFRTVIPPKGPGNTAQLMITNVAGHISISARAHHQTSTATVTSANHSPVVLSGIHYACPVPPTPSFCPGRHRVTKSGYQLQFPIRPKAPIIVLAKLSLSTSPPARKIKPSSSAVVSTYTITEKVKAVGPKSPARVKFEPTAVVKAGDSVDFETHVGGKVSGAPQPVTITIPQGPASTLTITASVPGGAPSHATITAAGGAHIALVLPHFTCFLPPYPTFCPASRTQFGNRAYKLVFQATPNISPIIVVVKAQAA
jgi:hypothetical protein